MFNVDALTKTLSAMPLPQLQQYAAMHKNDPYVVSMALSIANQKKEAQTAMHGQAAPQMPKVADQAIASIAPQAQPAPQQALPEEQGIGALPAQNMQGFADGGIIGVGSDSMGPEQPENFAQLQDANESVLRMAGGGMVSFADGGMSSAPQMFNQLPSGSFGSPQAGAVESQPWAQRKMDEIAAKVQAGTASPQEKAWISAFGGDAMSRVNARQQQSIYKDAPNQMGGETARLLAASQPAQQVPAQAAPPVMPPAGIGALGAGAPPAASAPAAPSASSYMDRFLKEMPKAEAAPDKEAFMQERAGATSEAYDLIAKKLAESDTRMKSDKQESAYMAMIKGGLAAAAGASPFGLTNLAKGLESGASDYSDALKEFRKAAADQTKMEMDLARAKAADKRGDMDAYQKAMEAVSNRNSQINERKAAGVASLLGSEMTSKAHIAAAGASANAQRGLMEALGSAPENSALRKGFELSKQEGRIPMMYDAYVKAATDPMKGDDFVKKYPTFQTYLAGMGGAGTGQFITGPQTANAPVLQRKN